MNLSNLHSRKTETGSVSVQSLNPRSAVRKVEIPSQRNSERPELGGPENGVESPAVNSHCAVACEVHVRRKTVILIAFVAI